MVQSIAHQTGPWSLIALAAIMFFEGAESVVSKYEYRACSVWFWKVSGEERENHFRTNSRIQSDRSFTIPNAESGKQQRLVLDHFLEIEVQTGQFNFSGLNF